jgi:hypothetical protein
MTEKTPFDLFGFLEARTFPSEDVTVLTNEQLALEAAPLVAERQAALKKDKDADVSAIDKKLKKIETEAKKSALTFHLRGIPQTLIDEAFATTDEKGSLRVLAAMLIGVTGPDGTDSDQVFKFEDVERLYGLLPPQGAKTLTEAVSRLLVASLAFDGMADAGFLAKS